MSIASEITRINNNISSAYTACDNKGATMPATQNSANLADCIDSIPSGGGADSGGKYVVQVIDYDGTILKQDHLDDGETFTLPDSPTHTGLTFQEWSSPVTITNGSFTVEHDTIIGPVYTTVSGKSEFDIKLTNKTGLVVQLNIDGTKDWGDGTTDTNTSHTYTDYGEYTIICDGTSMPNTNNGIFNQVWNGNSWIADPLESNGKGRGLICTAARLAGGLTLQDYSFLCCDNMKYITIDNTIRVARYLYFNYSTHFKALIIPKNLGEDSTYGVTLDLRCTLGLKYLVIPNGRNKNVVLDYGNSEGGCGVETLVFPPKTTLGSSSGSYYLKRVCFDAFTVESYLGFYLSKCTTFVEFLNDSQIPQQLKSNAQGVLEWSFRNYTSVPTLSVSEGLGNVGVINHFLKIYVPASLEAAWKTATNWAVYADYIVGVAEPAQPEQIELMSPDLGGGTMDSNSADVADSIFNSGSHCMWGAQGGSATDYTFTTPSSGTTLTCQIVTTDANEGMYTVPDSFQVVVDNNVVLSYPSTVEDITEYMDLSTLPVGTVNLAGDTQVTLRFLEPTGFGDGIVYNLQFEQMPNT